MAQQRLSSTRAKTLSALQQLAKSLTTDRFDADPRDVQGATRLALISASLVPADVTPSWSEVVRRVHLLLDHRSARSLIAQCERLPLTTLERLARLPRDPGGVGHMYDELLSNELTRDEQPGAPRWSCRDSLQRRRSGSHYTPQPLADLIVSQCLTPLLEGRDSKEILELRICDPAMGAGVFLSSAARFLATALRRAQRREGRACDDEPGALRLVVQSCLYGVDSDPIATLLSQLELARQCQAAISPRGKHALDERLRVGNSLGDAASDSATPGLDYQQAFSDIFERENPGFDAIIGNPPWVAYVGRATQPLDSCWREYYTRRYQSFRKYRTLHGLFTERCTELLREGGRLGLLLPTSVADLDGYAPVRAAHDVRCVVDAELPDLGDGQFAEVFQPSMVLLSTRRVAADPTVRSWCLARSDLDAQSSHLLHRLEEGPRVPSELFGERGYQTTKTDRSHLRHGDRAPTPAWVALRSGTEVSEFSRQPPRTYALPHALEGKLRPESQWQQVRLLIRQTARFPIAASADGVAFRNSVLAGFESADLPWPLLLSYLNSTLVRWFHYQRHRDARQGMPQLKIAHLRALPRPPSMTTEEGRALHALGERLAARNTGITRDERAELDALTARAHRLSSSEQELVRRWGKQFPPPRPRSRR